MEPGQEAEIYKVTSNNADGKAIVVYVMPGARRMYARSMNEEYGNAEVEPMLLADVPAGILPADATN
jgi:hypothetical protein